ncbi:E3 ubiquitin-protein ligase RNF213-like [Dreissena polymorpha]|uniref:E3 ubiquitin-protein ligase RNF213-like n=1 Tax=Dreissena polymorpha TaxID=45954 RepID=UPI002264CFE8|nr:E3 ubiquitin-protein ligase RNF213-like [Dreissena polymorpha]
MSVDTTKRGHVLGKAMDGVVLKPERELNPTYCAAVRLMLHMAMYLGPVEQIQAIIKPQIATTEVSDFIMNHIKANVSDLKRALGRSVDDVILLMHVVIDKIEKEGEAFPAEVHLLSSKEDRKAWENSFATIVLRGILSQAENWLMRFNHEIVNDQRLGADPLLCLIYETENRQDAQDLEQLLEVPRMWRFRVPITIEHMSQELDSKMRELKRPPRILHRFLNEDYILQALRYLPSIMQLQRALLRRFQRKLDKAEAKRITVKDFKTELSECHGVEKWIDAFSMAWDATRTFLQHGCLTKSGRYTLPEELCNEQINDDTSLAIFLPTTDGPGLCSYAMLDYLFRKQNEMLEYYGQKSDRLNIPSVKPMNVNAAHLICYDHEHDIMPILLANCQYSFEIGVGTTVEYDFAGMERQLIDRLLYSKSNIELRPFLEVKQLKYMRYLM